MHLRNRLLGELKGNVAKIRYCSLGEELTGIDEVARGKTNLACLYCGVGALASQAALFKQIQEALLLSEAGEIMMEKRSLSSTYGTARSFPQSQTSGASTPSRLVISAKALQQWKQRIFNY